MNDSLKSLTTVTDVNYANFGRIGKVELLKDGQHLTIDLDGLDFKFQTNNLYWSAAEAEPASATVSILGLKQASVDYLCQFMDIATYHNRGIVVRVKAGYEHGYVNGMQTLFEFPVVSAIPSMPPDNWVTLTGMLYSGPGKIVDYQCCADLESYIKKNGKTESVYESMEGIGKDLGIHWLWKQGSTDLAKEHTIYPFSFCGGVNEAVDMFRRRCPFLKIVHYPAIEKGTGRDTFFDVYPNEWYEKGEDGKYHWTKPREVQSTWQVDIEHGMIGLPRFVNGNKEYKRANVRILLNPAIRVGDTVLLHSRIARDFNDKEGYRVLTVKHSGHLRGNEWYTDLTIQHGIATDEETRSARQTSAK